MLLLQIFRGALLGGGGLALGNGVALSYGGGHKVVTYVVWYLLAALLLIAGVVFWVEIHRRQNAVNRDEESKEGRRASPKIVAEKPVFNLTVGEGPPTEAKNVARFIAVPFVNVANATDGDGTTAHDVTATIEAFDPNGNRLDRSHGCWRVHHIEMQDIDAALAADMVADIAKPIDMAPNGQRHLLDVVAQDTHKSSGCCLVRQYQPTSSTGITPDEARMHPHERPYRILITLYPRNREAWPFAFDLTVKPPGSSGEMPEPLLERVQPLPPASAPEPSWPTGSFVIGGPGATVRDVSIKNSYSNSPEGFGGIFGSRIEDALMDGNIHELPEKGKKKRLWAPKKDADDGG